jgi:hypothetical protein
MIEPFCPEAFLASVCAKATLLAPDSNNRFLFKRLANRAAMRVLRFKGCLNQFF